ncbi:GNAT family N-acetyltransferase [Chryseobacterium sp. 3008163]|uniref:GNAT family N-acetyltransferase n=1 Tax=Chryseobacterium sp. 3008163 TaxID=2478663 RepID=UPI000F0C928F|nr:GNAT family N-acetyltransferase [Chryseobacterium sp. 3008163]AYN00502.1 GNAT family N-acetyltransferase [Chryseobacterium sp. 3008163]
MYNLLIRPLEIEDAKISWKWRNDPEVWKFTGSKPNIEISPEIELQWLQKVINEESSKRFAIVVNEKYIGNIQLTNITKNSAVFHIFIGDKDYWGKGISSLATYQLLYFAKTVLKLKTVELEVNLSHIAAIKSYESTGFKKVSQNEQIICMSHDLSELQTPTLSVFVMVYNHEKFLNQCLDGILMQKCNFSFDIVVGEDCSSDNSREILINYQKNHPGKFKLLLHKTNIGANKNQEQVLDNCTGRYIAICEGDDYWTDPLKLQKQVDFLENNPEYVLCFHDIKILKSDGEIADDFITTLPDQYEERLTLAKKLNYIHTPSVVFRNILKDELNTIEFYKSPIGDFFIYMVLTKYGKMGHIPETMAVYRYGVGMFSSLSALKSIKANLLLFTNLYSFEKDAEIKEIFFEHIQSCIAQIDNEFGKLQFENSKFNEILSSKRYRFLKKHYPILVLLYKIDHLFLSNNIILRK